MEYYKYQRIKKAKKALHYIAYGSLVTDTIAAVATILSLQGVVDPSTVLIGANIILTVVVGITFVAFGALVFLKHYEKALKYTKKITAHHQKVISKTHKSFLMPMLFRYKRWALVRRRFLGRI